MPQILAVLHPVIWGTSTTDGPLPRHSGRCAVLKRGERGAADLEVLHTLPSPPGFFIDDSSI